MSLGPVNSTASRLAQTRQTGIERAEPTSPTTTQTTAPVAEPERSTVDPAIQSGARETQRGVEDAIKSRLEQTLDGGSTGTPRRGLGGGSLEGEQLVNKRTGRVRRTAMGEDGADKRPLARASGQPAQSEVQGAAERAFDLAGKRTSSGTRVGLGDDTPIPGTPQTELA